MLVVAVPKDELDTILEPRILPILGGRIDTSYFKDRRLRVCVSIVIFFLIKIFVTGGDSIVAIVIISSISIPHYSGIILVLSLIHI